MICCLNLRCSPNAWITFVKNICNFQYFSSERNFKSFGVPSTDLVYPKSIVNSGSSAKSSLPWNTACSDKKVPARGVAPGATIDPTLPVTALLDLMDSAPLRGGDGERKKIAPFSP